MLWLLPWQAACAPVRSDSEQREQLEQRDQSVEPAPHGPRAQALGDALPTRATHPTRPTHPTAPRMSRDQLLAQLRARLSRPEGGLREQLGTDGSRRIALDGHLQHATLAIVDPDGRVRTRCVDSPAAAAHVLGVSEAQGTP